LIVNQVELTGLLKDVGNVEHLPHFRVDRGSSEYGAGQMPSCLAVVLLSFVANRVTSIPRATSASVKRLVTCSQGP